MSKETYENVKRVVYRAPWDSEEMRSGVHRAWVLGGRRAAGFDRLSCRATGRFLPKSSPRWPVWHDSFTCVMHVRHDSFLCATRLIYVCNMTYLCVRHNMTYLCVRHDVFCLVVPRDASSKKQKWLPKWNVRYDSTLRVICVRHDSFVFAKKMCSSRNHVPHDLCDMTHLRVTYMCDMTHLRAWYVCDMTHLYMRHNAVICATCRIYKWVMSHTYYVHKLYVRHGLFTCATGLSQMCYVANVLCRTYEWGMRRHGLFTCAT